MHHVTDLYGFSNMGPRWEAYILYADYMGPMRDIYGLSGDGLELENVPCCAMYCYLNVKLPVSEYRILVIYQSAF